MGDVGVRETLVFNRCRMWTSTAATGGGRFRTPRQQHGATELRNVPIQQARLYCLLAHVILAVGCEQAGDRAPTERLIIYCSVDEVFARSVLEAYEDRTGVELAMIFDSEAGKTTGLVNKIIREAEAGRPRADLFWSSELFHTILLGRMDLLEPYDSPAAADIPPRFRDSRHRWTALAARARVLAFDPRAPGFSPRGAPSELPRGLKPAAREIPTRWEACADPEVAGQLAFANPLFGTTRGHVAAMFALWGNERGRAFLMRLREGGVHIVDGNSSAVRTVIAGRALLAATDTDDVWVAQSTGASLDLAYPDMGDGGTLLIPCSVAIIKGTRHPEAARRLVDFLVSPEVERMLARSDSRNIPVRETLRKELGVKWPPESKVDYDAVADAMDEAVAAVREILIR